MEVNTPELRSTQSGISLPVLVQGLEIKEVTTKKMLKEFIYLPEKLHADHKIWAPPLYMDEWKFYNKKKNPSYQYSDTILYMAYLNGKLAGRIMGIINRNSNELRNEKYARFAHFESIENYNVAAALLNEVEKWAQEKGMVKIVGPLGFTDQEPEGFLIEGFEHETTIATYYNFEFILRFLEMNGYYKEVDYFVYRIPPAIPEIYHKISERLLNKDYKLVEFKKRKEIKPYIISILSLMNESFKDIYGYVPLNVIEMQTLAKQYYMLIDQRFLKIIMKDDQVIAFILGMPNISEGLRRSRGRLLPFGLFHILRAFKTSRQLDLLLGGIHPGYQKIGLDVLLGTAMIKSVLAHGFTVMDSHHELESNTRVRAEMERGGGEVYKKYRIYQKELL